MASRKDTTTNRQALWSRLDRERKNLLANPDLPGEKWLVDEEYPLYRVSNFGRVRRRTNAIMKEYLGTTGYTTLKLQDRTGKERLVKVHRLVARTFLADQMTYDKLYVNHLDGDKTNNAVSNLEWVTFQENIDHAWKTGLYQPGSKHLTINQVANIRHLQDSLSKSELARIYETTYGTVYHIIKRNTWKHVA